jgi:hypothetical protein
MDELKGFKRVSGSTVGTRLVGGWKGLRVCLKMTGGVGDALISLASSAALLTEQAEEVTAAVMPHQIPLMREVVGIDTVLSSRDLNDPCIRNTFDVVVDFEGTFNTSRQLRASNYYSLVGTRLGYPVSVGSFKFGRLVKPGDKPVVCLHPGASIANRRWADVKWFELAYQLAEAGCHVRFLGTKDEFGFNNIDAGILKLSDSSDDLVWQSKQLANADYFVGNDSGFCHIAGMLDVPGLVLFFATEPNDVISEYHSLVGLSVYDRLGIKPSRSLVALDETASRASESLSVADVITKVEVASALKCTKIPRSKGAVIQYRLAVVTDTDVGKNLASLLSSWFDVKELVSQPSDSDMSEYDAVLVVGTDLATVQLRPGGAKVRVSVKGPDDTRRAIRELLSIAPST